MIMISFKVIDCFCFQNVYTDLTVLQNKGLILKYLKSNSGIKCSNFNFNINYI